MENMEYMGEGKKVHRYIYQIAVNQHSYHYIKPSEVGVYRLAGV